MRKPRREQKRMATFFYVGFFERGRRTAADEVTRVGREERQDKQSEARCTTAGSVATGK